MVKEKQSRLMCCIGTGRYRINDDGLVEVRKSSGWRVLKPNVLKSGYSQLSVFNFRRGSRPGIRVTVYYHIFVYMFHNGPYEVGLVIDHIDGDNCNNHISNLRAVTPLANVLSSYEGNGNSPRGGFFTPIRGKDIKAIRKLHGEGHSQASIARHLGLKRLSVRYIIKRIDAGNVLKYEDEE
jgi:hypothetical protein